LSKLCSFYPYWYCDTEKQEEKEKEEGDEKEKEGKTSK
jgi:hypothetical protein